jgi:spermidine synthase
VVLGSAVSRKMLWCVCALGLITVAGGLLTPADRLARLLLTTRGGGGLIFYEEGRGATVAVAQQRSRDNVFRRLYIQGVSNSGDAMPSLRYMRLQAMLPLLIHHDAQGEEPKSALVIGFGTGITAGAVLHYPGLERRVCVELLPAVVRAGELFPENYKAGTDPRLQVRIGDGRQELMRSSDRYDLITLEPPPPSAEGVVNLYSTDFYRLASKRLEADGLFAQWLPLATQNDEDTRSLVRSFLDVFPYATLWTTEMHEMLLIGSQSPIELDAQQITRRFLQSGVSTSLQAVGISSPAALLATWVTGRDGLEHYAAHVRAVTDDSPRIEYASWVRPREITQVLPALLELGTDTPVVGADDALRAEIAQRRRDLQDFYAAGIAAYNGDRDGWSKAIERVMASDPDNPYYRWIAGGSVAEASR